MPRSHWPTHAVYVQGRVELQQLRDLFKLSFRDLKLVWRQRRSIESDSDDEEEFLPTPGKQKKKQKKERLVNARLYFTKKKAKKRMADIEETGFMVPFKLDDGYICASKETLGTFDVTLKDVPDVIDYRGFVIAKPTTEKPLSEEPVVLGYVKFVFEAPKVAETEIALGMAADADQIKRMAARARQVGPEAKEGRNVQNQHFYSRNAKEAWQKVG